MQYTKCTKFGKNFCAKFLIFLLDKNAEMCYNKKFEPRAARQYTTFIFFCQVKKIKNLVDISADQEVRKEQTNTCSSGRTGIEPALKFRNYSPNLYLIIAYSGLNVNPFLHFF